MKHEPAAAGAVTPPPETRHVRLVPQKRKSEGTALADAMGLDDLVASQDRVMLFVDGPKAPFIEEELNARTDWDRLSMALVGEDVFAGATYYTLDEPNDKHRAFLRSLPRAGHGYGVLAIRGEHDEAPAHATSRRALCVALARDLLLRHRHFDVAFIIAGDDALTPMVPALHTKGKRVFLVTSHGSESEGLLALVDKPALFLEDLSTHVLRGH